MISKFKASLFTLTILLLTVYLVLNIANNRVIGVGLQQLPDQQYRVTEADKGFWGGDHVQVGDTVVSIDGQPPGESFFVRHYNRIEQAEEIRLMRPLPDGGQEAITLAVEDELPTRELVLHLIIPLSAMLLFSAFSVFVHLRKGPDRAAGYLIMFFMSIGLAYFSAFSSTRLDPIGRMVLTVSFPTVPLSFLLFLNTYLKQLIQERFMPDWIVRVGLGLVVANLTLQMLEFVIVLNESWESVPASILLLTFILGNIYIFYKLIEKYIRHRHDHLKSLFKFTLIGHVVGFLPFLLLFAIPDMFGLVIVPADVAAVCLIGLPAVYLYMFTTKRLFDIDFLLSRMLYYTMIAFFPTLLITGLAVLIMNQHNYSWVKWVQMFLVVYLLITIFLFGKEYMDQRLRPKFNRDLYNFQGSLDRFSSRISRVMKRADLERVLEQEVRSILPVQELAFFEVHADRGGEAVSAQGHPREDDFAASLASELLASPRRLTVGAAIDVTRGLCVVIGHRRSTYQVLWIGEKYNRTQFNPDELGWLKTLANYSAIVYENLYLIENLIGDLESEIRKQQGTPTWVLRLIFRLSENERRKLASDLHDSALQDQLIWYRKLEAVMLDHDMSADLSRELSDIREGLLDVIHQIRETCNELRPPLLKEMGIAEALRSLFEQAQIRNNYAIDFEEKPLAAELTDEQTLTIFRIVQELLGNAGKHAKASRIRIELEQRGDLHLRYKDDGVGLNVEKLNDSYQHMGLSGIKERVRSLAGTITFRSEVGGGLEVNITLPMESAIMDRESGMLDDSNLAG
ncbi:sensor histidine kinase [Paenibacillus xanthanilyticus]|uniref:histidine kinase n=1 Tax=Paenibacillus xanthanilyticus TaxID=1783531 RepID=A0ABV8JU67_9BACL